MATQSYARHAKYVPGYHFVTFSLVLLGLIWAVKELIAEPSTASFLNALVALGLVGVAYYARYFAVKVQDRVIRLEELLRMERLLPADLKARTGELRLWQFVALRFASDGELAELTRRTLSGELGDSDAIKRVIKEWRPDYARA